MIPRQESATYPQINVAVIAPPPFEKYSGGGGLTSLKTIQYNHPLELAAVLRLETMDPHWIVSDNPIIDLLRLGLMDKDGQFDPETEQLIFDLEDLSSESLAQALEMQEVTPEDLLTEPVMETLNSLWRELL